MSDNPSEHTESEDEQTFTYAQAAQRLRVEPDAVRSAVRHRKISVVGAGSSVRIPAAQVAEWEKRFNRLNDEFAWLKPSLDEAKKRIRTAVPKAAAARLCISVRYTQQLCQQGLLPFFLRSFTGQNGHARRAIVSLYVTGLRRFATKHTSNSMSECARAYYELCKTNRRIM